MTKWEYKDIEVNNMSFSDEGTNKVLKEEGLKGWEAYFIRESPGSGVAEYISANKIFFKRELNKQQVHN